MAPNGPDLLEECFVSVVVKHHNKLVEQVEGGRGLKRGLVS